VRHLTSRSGAWRGVAVVAVAGLVVWAGHLDATQVRLANRVPRTYDLLSRLPGHPADPPEPPLPVQLDLAAMRTAARMVPRGATYAATTGKQPLLGVSVVEATALYFADALRVKSVNQAAWVISYDARPAIPNGLHPLVALQVGPHVLVIRTRHR
jgi:hypothetical protein